MALLTADQIREHLQKDGDWEPEWDATDEEWETFESIKEELFGATGGNDDDFEDDDSYWSDDEEL